jgi:hypothetical protein
MMAWITSMSKVGWVVLMLVMFMMALMTAVSMMPMMALMTVMFMIALMTVISVEPFFIGLWDFDIEDGLDVISNKVPD